MLLKLSLLFCSIFSTNATIEDATKIAVRARIKAFSDTVKLERVIGQILMTGLPADIDNYPRSIYFKKIIRDVKVGNFIINRYNIGFDEKSTITNSQLPDKITLFTNDIQSFIIDSGANIPAIISADFESEQFTSIHRGVYQSPSALTIAATRNSTLIRLVGQFVGYELGYLGVNCLLGPVFDLSTSPVLGTYNALATRTFGSDAQDVYNITSHYIRGAQEAGLITIGKHFPGIDESIDNPHHNLPLYNGGTTAFQANHLPYSGKNSYLDGVMTSHIVLGFMDNHIPATLSKEFVTNILRKDTTIKFSDGEILGCALGDRLIISDDLSDMKAVLKYKKANNISFANLAIRAFDAGHDILLFSHIETPKQSKRGKNAEFSVDSLVAVHNALLEYVKSEPQKELQFRESLRRVLLTKAKIDRNYNQNDSVFPQIASKWLTRNTRNNLDAPPTLVKNGYKSAIEFLNGFYDSATIRLSSTEFDSYNLTSVPPESKIYFFSLGRSLTLFQQEFAKIFPNSEYHKLDPYMDKSAIFASSQILECITKSDITIFTVADIESANILSEIIKNNPKTGKKIIAFIHTSPLFLDGSVFTYSNVCGNMSSNNESYRSDIKTLNGTIKPKHRTKLSINIGSGIYTIAPMAYPIEPATGFAEIPRSMTENEKAMKEEIENLKRRLGLIGQIKTSLPEHSIKLFILAFSSLVCVLMIILLANKNTNFDHKSSMFEQFKTFYFWKGLWQTRTNALLTLVLILFISVILYVLGWSYPLFLSKIFN